MYTYINSASGCQIFWAAAGFCPVQPRMVWVCLRILIITTCMRESNPIIVHHVSIDPWRHHWKYKYTSWQLLLRKYAYTCIMRILGIHILYPRQFGLRVGKLQTPPKWHDVVATPGNRPEQSPNRRCGSWCCSILHARGIGIYSAGQKWHATGCPPMLLACFNYGKLSTLIAYIIFIYIYLWI